MTVETTQRRAGRRFPARHPLRRLCPVVGLTTYLLAGIAPLTFTSSAVALSSDRDKPIELEADQAELDEARGVSIYTGNVVVVQGTLRLSGDKITVYTTDGAPDRLVAQGTPARFKQRPDGKPDDVTATARELEHLVTQDLLKLRGDAEVLQSGDQFRGDRMEYNIATDKLKASTDPGSTSRISITLQPRAKAAGSDSGQ